MWRENEILMAEVKKLMDLVPLLDRITEKVNTNITQLPEVVNTAFICREVKNVLEEFEKKINNLSRTACTNANVVMQVTGEDHVETDVCTATSKPTLSYKIPYKREQNQVQHDQIMEAIGVSDLASHNDLVRLHFPGLMNYCTKLIGEGKQPPAGINPLQCTGVQLDLALRRRAKQHDTQE